jgi:iron complex outermembrane receptor protein
MNRKTLFIGHLMAGACLVGPAYAQTATATAAAAAPAASDASEGGSQLSEVVVTAQRVTQSMQKVPIAVSAVSGRDLVARGITGTLELDSAVPNLNLPQNGTVLNPYLRGIGSNASDPNDEASVALYVDGVYIASPLANILNFNNIERVEVLAGPQGTLFGRNATGGVIQIITRDPSQTPSGEVKVSYGDYNTVGTSFYATTGIVPNLAADIAVSYNNIMDGYGRDITLNIPIMRREDLGLRSKILWTPNSTTQVRLGVDYTRVRSDGTPYQLGPGVIGADGVTTNAGPYTTNTNERNLANDDIWGVSLRLDHDFGAVRFVNISAYRHITGLYQLDEDATPTPVVNSFIHQLAKTYSQEDQLLSPADANIQWVVGFYYFDATYAYDPITIAGLAAGGPNASEDIFGTQETHSYSGYGQVTIPIPMLPGTKFTGGLRYTDENQSDHAFVNVGSTTVAAPPDQHQSFSKLTWRFALDHQFTENLLGYISDNRGTKSGGFNLIGPGAPGYKPEVLDAYEIGFKSEWLDRTLRVNVAGFYYDYTNIQVQSIQAGAVNTQNAAAATVKGFDATIKYIPIRNLTISSGIGYVYGKYTRFPNAPFTPPSPLDGPQTSGNASGNDIINSPRVSASTSVDYIVPSSVGDFDVDVTGSYRDKSYVSADNRFAIPAHTVFNASLGWTSMNARYGAQFWIHNMFDAAYYASRVETTVGDLQYLAAPRTFGVTLSSKF